MREILVGVDGSKGSASAVDGGIGLRLGRIPIQLVHHSHLPVVLVPPGAHA